MRLGDRIRLVLAIDGDAPAIVFAGDSLGETSPPSSTEIAAHLDAASIDVGAPIGLLLCTIGRR